MRWLVRGLVAMALVALVLLGSVALYLGVLAWNGGRGVSLAAGEITERAQPRVVMASRAARQAAGRALLSGETEPQILFGDLHVHTNYSADAHLQSLRILSREGRSPPADACDFARFCSQVDFWSINDHAESLTAEHWRETVEAVRQCNALAGDPASPDVVSFLGWEWSHAGFSPETHYGHKNVILRGIEDDAIPTRPIASRSGPPVAFLAMGLIGPLVSDITMSDFASFHRYTLDTIAQEDCADGIGVRDLPENCRESARDPAALFAKLDDWGLPAVVIPHGLSWGVTNTAHANLSLQLRDHDPRWQPLLEVYSGHGNSEVYRDFERPRRDTAGRLSCPTGGEDMELCCERAATLARARCSDPESDECANAIDEAQQVAARADSGLWPLTSAVEGSSEADWGECSQLQRSFLPSFDYRPRQSAQYALALGSVDGEAVDARYRWGFIAASDTHRSRPGTGYREFARQLMTDGVGYPLPEGLIGSRNESFYYTGGLAAVHAPGRDRGSIFDALQRRQVYGTSGDRILLWFDLLAADGRRHPMGSEIVPEGVPRFEVRALGAFEQKPGCPPFVGDALSAERIATLCRGHCYHPSEVRKPITRVEVVRIRPQQRADEEIRPLVEDPWRIFECPADGQGCTITFEDPEFVEFAKADRETLYYVRALQVPSPVVNGDTLRCERDSEGKCLRARPCGYLQDGTPDDCLAAKAERAWSSPLFLLPPTT